MKINGSNLAELLLSFTLSILLPWLVMLSRSDNLAVCNMYLEYKWHLALHSFTNSIIDCSGPNQVVIPAVCFNCSAGCPSSSGLRLGGSEKKSLASMMSMTGLRVQCHQMQTGCILDCQCQGCCLATTAWCAVPATTPETSLDDAGALLSSGRF